MGIVLIILIVIMNRKTKLRRSKASQPSHFIGKLYSLMQVPDKLTQDTQI